MWLYSFIFQLTKYPPEVYVEANANSSPELKNIPRWIFGLTELHEKAIKNQMGKGNKSYNNWVDVYLHFMLVVEVIKWYRILDLLMTLDAT